MAAVEYGSKQLTRPPTALGRQWFGDPRHGPLPVLLLLLTLNTGIVDAVSILSLGRVFVANMTGNVVFVGFAAAGAPGFSLSASLWALAGFVAGAFLGGILIRGIGDNRGNLFAVAVLFEALLPGMRSLSASPQVIPCPARTTTSSQRVQRSASDYRTRSFVDWPCRT
jgi:hypothetical protein